MAVGLNRRSARDGSSSAEFVRPSPLLGAAHLTALWALAIAQPLFELLGRNSVFFVARGNDAGVILAFALILTLAPLAVTWLIGTVLERADQRFRWGLHLLLFWVLTGALALQALGQIEIGSALVMTIIAGVVAGAATIAYATRRFMRSLMDVLTIAPAIVLALFLLLGPTSDLVLPQDEPEPFQLEAGNPAPVVVVVFDELPSGSLMQSDGSINEQRYPVFSQLARSSTWYRDATTVAGFTSKSVPALLSGRLPEGKELPIASQQPRNLFTLLGEEYAVSAYEDATQLCPERLCPSDRTERSLDGGLVPLFADLSIVSAHLLLPDSWRDGLPAVSETFGGFAQAIDGGGVEGEARGGAGHVVAMALTRENELSDRRRVTRFAGELKPQADDGRPTFNLIHIQRPHYPWRHLPDGRVYSPNLGEWIRLMDEDSVWQAPRSVTDIALQRHLLETGYADRLLGAVVRGMKEAGIWQQAALVVTSDHGGAMISGEPRRNPTPENIGQVAPVPLFIKEPGQTRGRVVDGPACTLQVVPRLAGILEIEVPWEVQECDSSQVNVADLPEGVVSVPYPEVLRKRRSYITRIEQQFGGAPGWTGVYIPRAFRNLVGRPAFPRIARRESQEAEREEAAASSTFDPGSHVPRALLQRGTLSGVEPGAPIVIAANGRVAAVGRAFALEGETRFSILLPPRSLRPGRNDIRVLGLRRGGRFQPLSH